MSKEELRWCIMRICPRRRSRRLTPVSYTHLDVYKRQFSHRLGISIPFCAAICRIVCPAVPVHSLPLMMILISAMIRTSN